jgi:hypothetical protein
MMKVTWTLASLVLLTGCSARESNHQQTSARQEPARMEVAPAEQAAPQPVTVAAMTLTGTIGCGHCTFAAVGECAAAVKSADGVVHVLDGVDPASDLFTQRQSGVQVSVTGTPHDQDGLHMLTVTSYQF